MITNAAVAADFAPTATPLRPDAPPRESIGPPVSSTAEARRAGARGASPGEDRGSFATALADQMDPDADQPVAAGAERAPAARAAGTAEDGDEPPPDGNALPPWLAGLPLPVTPATLSSTTAGQVAASPFTNEPPETAAAPTTTAPAGGASVAVAGSAPTDAPPAASIDAGTVHVPPAGEQMSAAADAVPLPDAEPLAVRSRAEALATAGAALPASARTDAPSPEAAAGAALPASASDVARLVAQAAGRQVVSGSSPADARLPSAATDRRAASGVLGTPCAPVTATTSPGGEASVAPVPRSDVTTALAADGEPPADPAPAILPSPSFAASLSATTTATPTPAAHAPALQIPVAVGAPDWDRRLGERIGVLVDQGLTNAQLKLSPAHLGPLEIRISVQSDQASVWFGTHSHATREALEAAAPKLRDMLGAQGFANVGVSVDLQQQAPRQNPSSSRYEPEYSSAAGDAAAVESTRGSAARAAGLSRLDAFA
jgi:flagellar hook-length control protein FliK